jgi:hypothetical protein
MKYKQKIDFIINTLLFAISLTIIILAITGYTNVKLLFVFVMLLYALFNMIIWLLTIKAKDYEGLYTFLGSIACGILAILVELNVTSNLSLLLLTWVGIMAVIKFIKTDYYNDRHDRMWQISIYNLICFTLTGVITSFCFNYSANVQILVLGFFFLINSILELMDPLTKYLISK